MELVGIDVAQVGRLARALRKLRPRLPQLDVFDERFYPSRAADAETAARYFMVLVAMDHRLSRPGRPYEACLEDGCYRGADLLYRLGKKRLDEDPGFFDPSRLASVGIDDIKAWLSAGGATPPDPEVRAMLLRDLGTKLLKLYGGSALSLLGSSGGRLRGTPAEPGLVDLLRAFRAFEDPVEKKTMLLAKFLKRRGLFAPADELDVAVDNHLTRQALRLGMVVASGRIWEKIKGGEEFEPEEDVFLRLAVRRAFRLLATESGIKAEDLDDFFWLHGRETCTRDGPACDRCPLRSLCRARTNSNFMVIEPNFYSTWYY